MRLLVVADLHYSLRQLDWLLREAASYDLVVVAGDLLDLAGAVDLDTQIVVVSKYLGRLRAVRPLAICSGNHDVDARDAAGERVAAWVQDLRDDGIHVDGQHLLLGDTLISICPWWDGPHGQAAVARFLAAADRPPDGRWIWLHHVPPTDSPVSWTGRSHDGDAALEELIRRHAPDLVLSGHAHGSPFRAGGSWIDRVGRTWVFNPGRQLGALPTFIAIDLARDTASWTSLAGNDDRSLA